MGTRRSGRIHKLDPKSGAGGETSTCIDWLRDGAWSEEVIFILSMIQFEEQLNEEMFQCISSNVLRINSRIHFEFRTNEPLILVRVLFSVFFRISLGVVIDECSSIE